MSIDLNLEIQLPENICPEQPYRRIDSPRNILLTGCTGYLGAFLIGDLLKLTNANVYCLVRAADDASAKERLIENFNRYGLQYDQYLARIVVVAGDLEKPQLGLVKPVYDWLATNIDTIYHAAASVSFMPGYEKLKNINVGGLIQILQLACSIQTKAVHYVSTYAVFNSDHYKSHERVFERELEGSGEGLPRGYDKTKWVAEKICGIAKQRGIPVTMYRAGFISGDTETGVQNVMDPLAQMLAVSLCTGYGANTTALMHLTPVDYCSLALAKLSLHASTENKIFHLVQDNPLNVQEVLDWLEQDGYQIQRVDFNKWYEELKKICTKFPVFLPVFGLLTLSQNRGFEANDNLATLQFDSSNVNQILEPVYRCPPIHHSILKRYFRYITSPDRGYIVIPKRA